VAPAATTVERVVQSVTMVNQPEKAALLTLYLKTHEIERALVFSRTKHGADKIVRWLIAAGIDANAIHGNKSQPQRERAIAAFKSGQVKVLVATDIAARGIDIPGVSHVVNFDLPDVPEQYVHRIGRTARAGATGIAIAFCAGEERGNLRDIERTTRQKLTVDPLPNDFAAALQAFKALRPAPAPREEHRPHYRQQRPQRAHTPNRHPAHRGEGVRPEGARPQGPRPQGARPQPARPEGGRPSGRFGGNRRRGGGGGRPAQARG
jgi:ATP-dependent RNA helicase RhlE